MDAAFAKWLEQNDLILALCTSAGDCVYVNRQKRFGVLEKFEERGVQSFYLDDIVAFETRDDEKMIARWEKNGAWGVEPKSDRHSTNEMCMNLRLVDGKKLTVQLFKAAERNVERDSEGHRRLYRYACNSSQCLYNLIAGK